MSSDKKDNPELNIGSSIGMSFNYGKIEHEIYGTAHLCGTIPLLLPYGKYIEPTIKNEPKKLETMVIELTPEYRDLWEDELDSQISTKLKDYILITSFLNPIEDISTPKMKAFISLMCLAFAMDDIVDRLNSISDDTIQTADIKRLAKFEMDLYGGIYKNINELPNPIPAIQSTNIYSWKSYKLCESSILNFIDNNKYFKQEYINAITCYPLIFDDDGFSYTSKTLFNAYLSAMPVALEFVALIRNVKLSDEIRNDILFQRLKTAFGIASNLLNDVIGCGRDIRLNQVKDSFILTDVVCNGIPLQIAFNKVFDELCNEINDIKIACKKLAECYWDDEDLLKYINCVEHVIDGQIYAYGAVQRYGNLNFQIVSN